MKRALTFCTLLVASVICAQAMVFTSTSEYNLTPDQTLDDELWLFADSSATIEGLAEDDVFVVTTTAELSGKFSSDLWAMGDKISFTGHVNNHLRLAGRTIRIAGQVDRNLMAAGTTVELDTGAVVQYDALLIGENVLFKGEARHLRIFGSKATLSGRVRGNVRISASDIVVLPGTEIDGNLVYTSPDELVLDNRVKLHGELKRSLTHPGGWARTEPTPRQRLSFQSFLYISALLTVLAFAGLFPQYTGRAVRTLRQSPGWCALTGLLAFGLMPMIGLVSMLTLVGFAIGALTLGTYLGLLYLAKGIVALVIGGILLRRRGPQPFRNVFTALSLGLIVLYAAAWIPWFGRTIWAVTGILGLGALIIALFSRDNTPASATGQTFSPPPLPGSPTSSQDVNETGKQDRKE